MSTSEATVSGLDGPIVIHRDEWGIPHARATSVHDAFVAQGFVQAEDRLGQLEYDRRRAYGRWAEVVGPAAVEFDAFTRRADLSETAELNRSDPSLKWMESESQWPNASPISSRESCGCMSAAPV